MKNILILIFSMSATLLLGQDYAMFETHYLTPKAGHRQALMAEIAEHNRLYHADGPYHNSVFSVVNGTHSDDLFFAMGPFTFSQNDDRPSSAEHALDWASVISHTHKITNVEYWVRDDDLSYAPEAADDFPMDLSRVRFFEVADNELFAKVQKQIIKTLEGMGIKRPRTMYKKQFMHKDGRDWAAVSSFKNWAELDDDSGPGFEETFKKVNGEDSWEIFQKEFDQTVISRDDEWRTLLRDVMAGDSN